MTTPAKPRRRKLALALLGVLLAVTAIGGGWAYRAMREVEPFYAAAIETKPAELERAGRRMEDRVADLATESQTTGRWESKFTADEVNGWVALMLKEKYPDLLPPEVIDPRVAFSNGRCQVGYRYEGDRLRAVITIEGDASMANHDVAAVRLRRARFGALPLPLSQVVEEINERAADLDVPIKWIEQQGDPVLLVAVTNALSNEQEVRRLEKIDILEGELVLAGTATPRSTHVKPLEASHAAPPSGLRLARYRRHLYGNNKSPLISRHAD